METYLLATKADTDMLGNPDWSATTAVLGLATDDGVHGEVAMTELKIAIIVGSTRPGRHAPAVAEWVGSRTTLPNCHHLGGRC